MLRAEEVAVGVGERFRVSLVDGGGQDGRFLIGMGEEASTAAAAAAAAKGGKALKQEGDSKEEEEEEEEGTEHYICVEEPKEDSTKGWEVTGNGEAGMDSSTILIRMQAQFKPKLKADREMKAREKISRRELEAAVGRRLEEDEVKRLKRARRNGTYHEEVLDVRVKGKHDKFAS